MSYNYAFFHNTGFNSSALHEFIIFYKEFRLSGLSDHLMYCRISQISIIWCFRVLCRKPAIYIFHVWKIQKKKTTTKKTKKKKKFTFSYSLEFYTTVMTSPLFFALTSASATCGTKCVAVTRLILLAHLS